MKTTLINAVRTIGFFAAIVTMIAVQGLNAQSGKGGGGRLEGVWDAQISITDCSTGGVIRSFASLGMFMRGGTMLDSTSGVPQAMKTPGEGVWRHTEGNNYKMRFKSFSFNAQNVFTGWTTIQHEISIDSSGDSYTSAGTAEIYAPNGVLLLTLCSSSTATRFDF
jgi:hypothetical protein